MNDSVLIYLPFNNVCTHYSIIKTSKLDYIAVFTRVTQNRFFLCSP